MTEPKNPFYLYLFNGPNTIGFITFAISGFLIFGEFNWGLRPEWIFVPPLMLFLSVNVFKFDALWENYTAAQHKDYGDMIYYVGFFTSISTLGMTLTKMKPGSDFYSLMYKFGIGLLVTGFCVLLRIFTIETAEKIEEEIESTEAIQEDDNAEHLDQLIKAEIAARTMHLDTMKKYSDNLMETLEKSSSEISEKATANRAAIESSYRDLSLIALAYKTSLESLKKESDSLLTKMNDSTNAPTDHITSLSLASEKIKELSKHIDNFGASLGSISKKRGQAQETPVPEPLAPPSSDNNSIFWLKIVIAGIICAYLVDLVASY